MSELKPCPFCGIMPAVSEYEVDDGETKWAVGCDCRNAPEEHAYAERYTHAHGQTAREAITAWNTRPREAALEAEVERLRVALKDCADDLEAEILARANSELPRRIDRDLETVRVARQALSPNNPAGQAMEGDHG